MTTVLLVPVDLENCGVKVPLTKMLPVIEGAMYGFKGVYDKHSKTDILYTTTAQLEEWMAYENAPIDMNDYNVRFIDTKDLLILGLESLMAHEGGVSVSDLKDGGINPQVCAYGNIVVSVTEWVKLNCMLETYDCSAETAIDEAYNVAYSNLPLETIEQMVHYTRQLKSERK